MGKIYSLRPPSTQKDATLETLFRVEMKKDDLIAEGLKAGDLIAVVSQSGKGGVGVVYLSTDTTKSQGTTSFVKVHPSLREFMSLELSDKCTITKFEGSLRKIKTVTIRENANGAKTNASVALDRLVYWAEHSLVSLCGIISDISFSAVPVDAGRSFGKQMLTVTAIESCDAHSTKDAIAVPFYFDPVSSKVQVEGCSSTPEEALKDAQEPANLIEVGTQFSDLPGLEGQLKELQYSLSRINSQLEEQRNIIRPCVPILLHGSQGKLISKIMKQLECCFNSTSVFTINSSITRLSSAKLDTALENAFKSAISAQPSLILIRNIDEIVPKQSDNSATADLLNDLVYDVGLARVQIVASAKRPVDIHPSLLAVLADQIEIPTPDAHSRLKFLHHHLGGYVEKEVLEYVAEKTHAFSYDDLWRLWLKADDAALRPPITTLTNGSYDVNGATETSSRKLPITKQHFDAALTRVHPSLMHDLYIEVPKVKWSEIAGSSHIQRKLREAVEQPLKLPKVVAKLGLQPAHGLLLYGPPGCSKTMTAKALATESGLNFIAVKGPELISKYVGDSEYKIREVFRKARAASPSIIFFDEIDSIAPNREGGGHEGLNTVATLLNEMDGVEDVERVLVLAATNRPDAIDPALLRPGRLGTTLYVGPPNHEAILQIMESRTRNIAGASNLDLAGLASRIVHNGRFSGADVGALCDAAKAACVSEISNDDEDPILKQEHFETALVEAKPSLDLAQLAFLQDWEVGQGL